LPPIDRRAHADHRIFEDATATLTGYAYETVPRKGIRAGRAIGEPEAVNFMFCLTQTVI
jgi:hypothetical protein